MKSAKWENIFKGWNSSESEAVHTLKKVPVFKNLSRNDFSELENMMHHRDYKIGDFVNVLIKKCTSATLIGEAINPTNK